MPRPRRQAPEPDVPTFTFTQEKLDRIIGERVAVERAKLGPRAAVAEQYREALALAMTRITALEGQLRAHGIAPAVTLPEDAQAADVEPEPAAEPEDVEPEEPAQAPRDWSVEDFTGSPADRVARRLGAA